MSPPAQEVSVDKTFGRRAVGIADGDTLPAIVEGLRHGDRIALVEGGDGAAIGGGAGGSIGASGSSCVPTGSAGNGGAYGGGGGGNGPCGFASGGSGGGGILIITYMP
jgi:hypothetical protein